MARLWAFLVTFSLLGCGDGAEQTPPETTTVVIAPLEDLTLVSAGEDPLAPHRPEVVDCSNLTGWYVEEGRIEANTAECNYLALVEPAAARAHAGEVLKSRLSHFDLTAPESAEAHVALLVLGEVIWEQHIEIPRAAQVIEISVELERDIQEGDAVGIHLHNHGQNTWNLSPLFVERAP